MAFNKQGSTEKLDNLSREDTGSNSDNYNSWNRPSLLNVFDIPDMSSRPQSDVDSQPPPYPSERVSYASSYLDDDSESDSASCNDDTYTDYNSRRSSQYTSGMDSGTLASKSERSVDFMDQGLYNSLARKYDSMDRSKKGKGKKGSPEDSGNGTDWKSDSGSIAGAKFIQTPLCENDDDDEVELSRTTWDIFQTIPRERVSSSEMSVRVLKWVKVILYGLLFISVLGSAVFCKFSLVILTSNIALHKYNINPAHVRQLVNDSRDIVPELKGEDLRKHNERTDDQVMQFMDQIRNSAVFFIFLAMIIPDLILFVLHCVKSLFGSQPWPTMRIILMSLIFTGLETLGQCMLMFKVLPHLDVVRAAMLLSCLTFVPGVVRLIFGKENCDPNWIITRRVILVFALIVQFTGILAVLLFGYGWNDVSPRPYRGEEMPENYHEKAHYLYRAAPEWSWGSMNNVAMNWEVIFALLFSTLSWCENFLEANRVFCGRNINVCKLKSILHTVRQKNYVFISAWKVLLTLAFVYALVPFFDSNADKLGKYDWTLDLVTRQDPDTYATDVFANETKARAEIYISEIRPLLDETANKPDLQANLTKALQAEAKKIYVNKDINGFAKHPKKFLEWPDPANVQESIVRALEQMYLNVIESGDEFRHYARETINALQDVPPLSADAKAAIAGYGEWIYSLDKPGHIHWEYFKQRVEEFWTIMLIAIKAATCSYFAKLSCKLCMQYAGFAVPLTLCMPVTVFMLWTNCRWQYLPGHTHMVCPEEDVSDYAFYVVIVLGIFWWISELVICSHIWTPCKERLARTDKLFVVPGFSMTMIEQTLLLNRRRNDDEVVVTGIDNHINYIGADSPLNGSMSSLNSKRDDGQTDHVVPKIYAVATMWHETKNEMTQLMKSMFRMDSDQSARRNAQKYFGIRDPDYYEFEAHILFDDALEFNDSEERIPNDFVVSFCDVIDMAASSVHETAVANPPPTRIPTPYGGQLKWTLPGGTILTVHIKDKDKIRHKKRWSQVMYMYYLLGFRMIGDSEEYTSRTLRQGTGGKHISWAKTATKSQKRRKTTHYTKSDIFDVMGEEFHVKAENTFLLTLDGDVDFKPDAVRLLMDRMKKNKKVGAACGRIHPIGQGPMIWYQKFEYACGHWLQKAAEHVFGCVLCAPGCFSLFRGSALMDDNVMNTYTTMASKAAEFVQYDQGEDRWLCTLILQQGYRVEYCAASDALTFAPEQFNEFYNQRRRWGPSTMANTIDLLSDSSNTSMVNDNISMLYLMYQFLVFGSSILGPATVLLMTAGAYHTVFRLSLYWSYGLALLPPAIFLVICMVCKSHIQLMFAALLSAFFAIIMMVVLVGTAINFVFEGWTSPNVVFVVLLISVFAISAVLHPQEMTCMLYGPLYFLSIPSGYLLLTIYFLCNLNVISWGTRETMTKKTKAQLEAEEIEKQLALKKKQENKLVNRLGITKMIDDMKELFSTMVGLRQSAQVETKDTEILRRMYEALDTLPDRISGRVPSRHVPKETKSVECQTMNVPELIPDNEITEVIEHNTEPEAPKRPPRDDLRNPAWLEDERLGDGPITYINRREAAFWKQLIQRYLFPIEMDKDQKRRLADELKSLRNNVVFAFFMLNLLWIVVVFQFHLLQTSLNQDLFDKNGGSQLRNCTRMAENGLFIPIPRTDGTCVGIEPLSFVFLTLFTTILLVQFFGMFVHRWGTFLHLIAITSIKWPWSRKMGDVTRDTLAAIELVTQLQKVKNMDPRERFNGDTDTSSIYSISTVDQSQTGTSTEADSVIARPRVRRPKRQGHLSLDRVFRKRFHKLKKELEVEIPTDAEDSSFEGPDDEPVIGNKVYRTVRERMTTRRGASFNLGRRRGNVERRGSFNHPRPRYHDI